MRPSDEIHKLIKSLNQRAGAGLDARIYRTAAEARAQENESHPAACQPAIWRIVMRSRFAKLAAAAAIVIAAAIGIGVFTNGSVTYAKVIQPILNARTFVLDIIAGDESTAPVMHDVVADSRIRRTFSNAETVLIIDLDNARMLTLYPPGRTAIYVDIQGPVREGTKHFVRMVQNIVDQTRNDPHVKELGKRQIDGRAAVGFHVESDHSQLTIWADAETALPLRIEVTEGGEHFVMKNIEFDVPVDAAEVSMDVPAGYTLQDKPFDMSQFSEKDLVETLRIWAEIINDGVFPDEVTTEAQMQLMPKLIERIGQLQGLNEQQMTQIGVSFGKGMIFRQMLGNAGQWKYVGAGVKLGDAETPVCWFRAPDSQTYRIIYGDLSVRDVDEQDLPK